MSGLVSWARVAAGVSVGVLLLAVLPPVLTDSDEPVIGLLLQTLGVVGIALMAAGWGLAGRWVGPGFLVRGAGLVAFGLAMVAFVVMVLPLAGWLVWPVLLVAYAACLAFVAMLVRGDADRQPLVGGPDDRLEVPVARGRTLVLAAMGLMMAAPSLVIAPIPVVGWVFGTIGVLFFGGAALWLIARLVRPGPAVVVDAEGIEDRSGLAAVGRLPWSQVARVRTTSVKNQPMVAITPVDGQAVLDAVAPWKRPLLAMNRRLTGSHDVLISVGSLPCSAAELTSVVDELRRRHS